MSVPSPASEQKFPSARFLAFTLLTFLLLGLLPISQALFGVRSLDFGTMGRSASEQTGVPWTSSLIDVVRLAQVEPGLWLLLLGSAIPTLAALVVLLACRDWSELRAWAGRFNPALIWRHASLRSASGVAMVLLAVIACLFVAFELRALLGLEYQRGAFVLSAAIVPALLASMFLDQGAVLEEGGWRSYAMPLLQDSGMKPVYVALLIGLAWGLWHLPRDVVSGVIDRLGFTDYLLWYLPAFLTGTVSVSVIAAYCVNRLGGSVFPAIAIHGLTNDAIGISGAATIEVALTPLHQMTKATPLLVLALIILLGAGSSLGRRQG